MLNKSLSKAIYNVMQSPGSGLFTISLKILATDGSFTYSPIHVERVDLSQDFIYGYGDQLKVTFPIAMSDYAQLYKHYNNLTAQLTIKLLSPNGMKTNTDPVLVKKFYPVFDDFKDPNKMMTDVESRVTPNGNPITITLVEPTLYHIKHMPMQGIFHTSNIAGIMSHLAEAYQIKKTYIQTPDNDHTYDHIVIPPYKEFKDVFHYLQERYGVYMLGFNNYFTNDTLSIWPTLDTNPKAPFSLKLYQADDGSYAGAPSFYQQSGDDLSVVINNSPNAQDYSLISSEHRGQSAQFLRSATQIDGIMSQDSNGILTFNQDNVINVRLNNSRLGRQDAQHTTYVHQTDNMFEISSQLARRQYVFMVVRWPQARPWLIRPGTAVRYYSDEKGKVGKRTGLVDRAIYRFQRGDRSQVNTYTCLGTLGLRLDPNEQLSNTVS